jgi:hypothetical protein
MNDPPPPINLEFKSTLLADTNHASTCVALVLHPICVPIRIEEKEGMGAIIPLTTASSPIHTHTHLLYYYCVTSIHAETNNINFSLFNLEMNCEQLAYN